MRLNRRKALQIAAIGAGALLLGKTPHHPASERRLVGGLLIDGISSPGAKEALDLVRPRDLVVKPYAEVYSAIHELARRGLPVDVILVHETLRRRQRLEHAGGSEGLVELTEGGDQTRILGSAQIVRTLADFRA